MSRIHKKIPSSRQALAAILLLASYHNSDLLVQACRLRQMNGTGVTAGAVISATPNEIGHRRLLNNVDFEREIGIACNDPGIHNENRKTKSWQECENLCRDESECQAYDYNDRNGKCYLKATPCLDKEKDKQGHHVGKKIRDNPAIFGNSLIAFDRIDGMGCEGDEIPGGNMQASSRAACEELCRYYVPQGCQAYSFAKSNKKCYLKNDRCVVREPNSNNDSGVLRDSPPEAFTSPTPTGVTPSQVKNTVAPVVDGDFLILEGVVCLGSQIDILEGMPSNEACGEACKSVLGCMSYSFDNVGSECLTYSDECSTYDSHPSFVSGILMASP